MLSFVVDLVGVVVVEDDVDGIVVVDTVGIGDVGDVVVVDVYCC